MRKIPHWQAGPTLTSRPDKGDGTWQDKTLVGSSTPKLALVGLLGKCFRLLWVPSWDYELFLPVEDIGRLVGLHPGLDESADSILDDYANHFFGLGWFCGALCWSQLDGLRRTLANTWLFVKLVWGHQWDKIVHYWTRLRARSISSPGFWDSRCISDRMWF